MTTIAWDGHFLAADRMACSGNTKRAVTKIWRIDSKVNPNVEALLGFDKIEMFAWSGEHQDAIAIRDFLRSESSAAPKIEDREGCGLVIYRSGAAARIEYRLLPSPIEEKICAIGSGRDFAIGAMAHGANAVQALSIAGAHDCYTGLGADVLEKAL